MKSLWESNVEIKERAPLGGDKQTQTVVIGAGITGILIAYFLKKNGQKVIVIEANRIGSGQTRGTTAKITSQHGMCYHRLIHKIGREKARLYAQANEKAIRNYEKIIKDEKIDCHFEKKTAYLYTTQDTGVADLKKEAEAARLLGIPAHFVEGDQIEELPFGVKGATYFENQAQFHPLAFIQQLAAELEIYENTKVLSVKKHMVLTDKGKIEAENIVFAAHYPFINVPGFYFLRQHQERSYVVAVKGTSGLSGMYYGIDEGGLSLRSIGDIILLGDGGHRTGKNKSQDICCENQKTGYSYLRKMAKLYYPNAREVASWSAQDCMPHDGIPFIGTYSAMRPYWYVATGFQKWGMTSAMIAADHISKQICGMHNAYEELFTPQRMLFRAAFKNFMADVGESISGLGKGLFGKRQRRCPHMGCHLEWNEEEESWDCPCHGSRFDADGHLLDNPAQIDLRRD